jgi:hypothetical protein
MKRFASACEEIDHDIRNATVSSKLLLTALFLLASSAGIA